MNTILSRLSFLARKRPVACVILTIGTAIAVQAFASAAETSVDPVVRVLIRVNAMLDKECPQARISTLYALKQIDRAFAMNEPKPYNLLRVAAGKYFDCSQNDRVSASTRNWATLRYSEDFTDWAYSVWFSAHSSVPTAPIETYRERLAADQQLNSDALSNFAVVTTLLGDLNYNTNDKVLKDYIKFQLSIIGGHKELVQPAFNLDNSILSNLHNQ